MNEPAAGDIVPPLAFFTPLRESLKPALTRGVLSLRDEILEFAFHTRKDACPIPLAFLPEETRRRIPRAVLAIEQPPRIRKMFERDPDRATQRSGEVRNGRIRG